MPNVMFKPKSLKDYTSWHLEDPKTSRKIDKLLIELSRDPLSGLGKMEKLKGNRSGLYSRRIDDKNRLVYRVDGDIVTIENCKGHYDDK